MFSCTNLPLQGDLIQSEIGNLWVPRFPSGFGIFYVRMMSETLNRQGARRAVLGETERTCTLECLADRLVEKS
jgi:hypothetical protein